MYLLLEVASLLFINEHQIEVIANRELFVDVPHCGSHFIASQEESDRD